MDEVPPLWFLSIYVLSRVLVGAVVFGALAMWIFK